MIWAWHCCQGAELRQRGSQHCGAVLLEVSEHPQLRGQGPKVPFLAGQHDQKSPCCVLHTMNPHLQGPPHYHHRNKQRDRTQLHAQDPGCGEEQIPGDIQERMETDKYTGENTKDISKSKVIGTPQESPRSHTHARTHTHRRVLIVLWDRFLGERHWHGWSRGREAAVPIPHLQV